MTSFTPTEPEDLLWSIHVDGSFNSKGSGAASLIIENCDKIFVEVSLAFSFATPNNQAEYEVCIDGLLLAKDFNASQVEILTNSLMVVSQTKMEYEAKNVILQRYLARVMELMGHFSKVEIKRFPQGENTRADVLSKLERARTSRNHRSVI